ncbi:MAG: Mu transposase domain-containing protein [Dehalococcoidia bacterium]
MARYYGCLIDPARVATPTDKPRVERGVSYARESFFRGQTFVSLAAMRAAARRWAKEVAGVRRHGTTQEALLAAFRQREESRLRPLPPEPWEPVTWTRARVQADCHLVAQGVCYSVPFQYVGQDVDVRLGRTLVQIYAGTTLLTSHVRQERGRVTRVEHYAQSGQAFLRATPRACLEHAEALGPAVRQVVATLLESERHHDLRQVQALLRLAGQHEAKRLDHACALALEVGDARYRTVRRLLEQAVEQLEPETAPPSTAGAYLRGPEAFGRTGTEGT